LIAHNIIDFKGVREPFRVQLKIKNSHQKNIPKFILTLTVGGRKLSLSKPKFKAGYRGLPVCSGSLLTWRVREA
jgi:hypothetical protein